MFFLAQALHKISVVVPNRTLWIESLEMETNSSVEQTKIQGLIKQLWDSDGATREKARGELIEIGGPDVTRALIIELNDPRRDVRWEAGKALISIADPIAAPALVNHLMDEDGDIRWLAAEGLAVLGIPGLLATLNASTRHASDNDFVEAVHHAFKQFKKHGIHAKKLDPVVDACEHNEPGVGLPVEAYKLLQELKVR